MTPNPDNRSAIRAVLAPFLITRCAILAIFLMTLLVRVVPTDSEGVNSFTIQRPHLLPALRAAIAGGDSTSYVEIARDGYRGEITRVYPPAFPLTLRAAAWLTGEYWLTACVLNTLLLFGGLVALYKIAILTGLSPEDASRAATLCCIFPATCFFSLPFAESLLFLSAAGAILFALQGRWWLAGLCGIIASATKVPGSLVAIPLLILYYRNFRIKLRWELIPVLLAPSGMAAYLLYLRTQGTLDFSASQRVFGHRGVGSFLVPVWEYIRHPNVFSAWNLYPLHFAILLLMLLAGYTLIRAGKPGLGLYAIACILLPLTATQTMASLTRYSLPCVSLYIGLAMLSRTKWAYETLYAASVLLSAAMTLLFALHFGIAMA